MAASTHELFPVVALREQPVGQPGRLVPLAIRLRAVLVVVAVVDA